MAMQINFTSLEDGVVNIENFGPGQWRGTQMHQAKKKPCHYQMVEDTNEVAWSLCWLNTISERGKSPVHCLYPPYLRLCTIAIVLRNRSCSVTALRTHDGR